jgi:hypothetical protein
MTAHISVEKDGALLESQRCVFDLARREAESIAHLRPRKIEMPVEARQMIERYVGSPAAVNAMVTIGHGVAEWLSDSDRE